MNDHLAQPPSGNCRTISIILAAGRGSRMNGYNGCKTLLPLEPQGSAYEGRHPIIQQILANLPNGPKAVVVHHCKEAIKDATASWNLQYFEQTVLNGTGGALLAAATFVRGQSAEAVIITMGDTPFICQSTYQRMVNSLEAYDMVILGFTPDDKKQYGVVDIRDGRVQQIVEWKYWQHFVPEIQNALTVCNAGIYAVRKDVLERYFPVIETQPQVVHKLIDGRTTAIEKYFLTDLVKYMVLDGRPVGLIQCDDEYEPMGIDD